MDYLEMIDNTYEELDYRMDSKRLAQYIDKKSNRYLHILGVVDEMRILLKDIDANEKKKGELILAAFLHDIGYSEKLKTTGFHPMDGAMFCYRNKLPKRIVSSVMFHSGAYYDAKRMNHNVKSFYEAYENTLTKKEKLYIDLITFCDLHRSPKGEKVTFNERMNEIKARYGEKHSVYTSMEDKRLYFEELIKKVNQMKK